MRFLKLLVKRVTVKGKRKDTRRWAHAWPRQKFERELQLCLHGLASSYDLKLPPPPTTPTGYHPASPGKGGNQPASPGKGGTQPASPASRGSSRTASAKWGSQSTKSQSTGWSTKSTPSLLRATPAAGRRKEGSQPGPSGDNQPTSGGGNQPTSKSSSTASDEHVERPAPLACSAPHVPPAAPAAPATSAAPADSADPADSTGSADSTEPVASYAATGGETAAGIVAAKVGLRLPSLLKRANNMGSELRTSGSEPDSSGAGAGRLSYSGKITSVPSLLKRMGALGMGTKSLPSLLHR